MDTNLEMRITKMYSILLMRYKWYFVQLHHQAIKNQNDIHALHVQIGFPFLNE